MTTLYHGTTEENYNKIIASGAIMAGVGGVFFTPRIEVAEMYGDCVVSVNVDDDDLMITLI